MKRIKTVVGRFSFVAFLLLGPVCALPAALTRLDVSYYSDYGVRVSLGDETEAVFASALTASYLPGARKGAESAPLPPGYPASFIGFSLDPRGAPTPATYWEPEALPSSNGNDSDDDHSPRWNPGGIYRAANLYNAYVGEVNTSTVAGRFAGAALQLAIWDVLYGDAQAVNHRNSNFFVNDAHGSQSQLVFAANAILASAANNVNPNAAATFWDEELGPSGRHPLGKDQGLLGPGFTTAGFVPEASGWLPATGATAGLALLGNRLRARKKATVGANLRPQE